LIERIHAHDYREQPWKNGGGLTREIAVAFSDDKTESVLWRVSLATIDRDGPFSEFRGYDRTIVALDADPVELDVDGKVFVLEPGQPREFRGEARVACRLRGGATRDLNAMTLRDAFVHDVEIVTSSQRFVLDDDEIAFVYAIDGEAAVENMPCSAGDTIWVQEADAVDVRTGGSAAVIRITPV
jgi:uncharacterized protein